MNSTVKKITIGSAAALPFVSAAAGADYVVRLAVNRNPPGAFTKLFGGEPENELTLRLKAEREKLRNSPHERVSILTPDGLRLEGHWFACPDAKRVIIAVHGWRSRWYVDFGAVADFWRENGCSVLYVEQRAQGESEGKVMTFGVKERLDCRGWARWAADRCGETPIYFAGISMGAASVLMASDLEMPASVRGIMADCGFTSPDAILGRVIRDRLRLPFVLTRGCARTIFRLRTGVDMTYSTLDALKNAKYPVFFVHGEADSFVPAEMTRQNYAACAAEKELLLVPGADHGMSYVVRQAEYESAVLAFWKKHDG